jgi:5-methyltetrahydrofolate--homocysteine methyltransferase
MQVLEELSSKVIEGNAQDVKVVLLKAIAEGLDAEDILNKGFISAMDVVGNKFKNNEIFIPEMLIAARAMKAGMEILKPILVQNDVKTSGIIVIGTVKGDLHDIGKNLVSMMLEGAGFEVVDLGVDVPVEKFIEAIQTKKPLAVCLSSLLTTTMSGMKDVVTGLNDAGLRDTVKIIIGGAPVTQSFADEIGADGYASDAGSGVDAVKQAIN